MDLLSFLLSIIKNGVVTRQEKISVPYNKLILNVLNVLYKEGLILSYFIFEKQVLIYLRAYAGIPLIKDLKRISKISNKKYFSCDELKRFYKKSDILLISTSKGVMTLRDALALNLGGEVLFEIKI